MSSSYFNIHLKLFFDKCQSDSELMKRLLNEVESLYYNKGRPCISNHASTECQFFHGGYRKKNNGPVFYKFDCDLDRKNLKVAPVLHFAYYKTFHMPYPSMNGVEYSHLCGRHNCVNPQHVRLEPHNINMDRKRCHRTRVCEDQHGQFDRCVFDFEVRRTDRIYRPYLQTVFQVKGNSNCDEIIIKYYPTPFSFSKI